MQIKTINGRCLYTHCYGHALHLAVADCIKSVPCISDSLDTVCKIGKLVKKSPQRNTKLDNIRADTKNESRGVHAFCPTRWTVRGEALAAVINNHAELMELWDWSLIVSKDTEMKARIRGVQSMMTTFNFFFGCTLGEQLLRQTDNLSRALQHSSTSAAQANRLAQDVVKTLLKDRRDTSFSLFWARILWHKTTEIQTIEDPTLPRKRKAPVRHEVREQDTHHFPETPKHHYRQIYFNAIDTITQCIATRFEQEDFKIYVNIQELLLKSFPSEPCDTESAEVVKMYSKDLDSFKLKGQLLLLPRTAKSIGFDNSEFDINDLITFLQSLDSSHRKLLSKISTLRKLLLVIPATNAVSERSFSALKWVKTYLRSTTGDSRLNHLMMLHVHKDRADALTLVDIANDFADRKKAIVWQIFPKQYPKQVLYFVKVNTNGKLDTNQEVLYTTVVI